MEQHSLQAGLQEEEAVPTAPNVPWPSRKSLPSDFLQMVRS